MASMRDSMVRNLRHFVEYDLATTVRWDTVQLDVHAELGGDVIEASFQVPGGKHHVVRIESPEYSTSNPCGCVLLDRVPIGPIDEVTWTKAALLIKAERARMIEASDGRRQQQHDGATVQ